MKPRLKSASLTEEDRRIWRRFKPHRRPGVVFSVPVLIVYSIADRQDADVMLNIAQGRQMRIDWPDGEFVVWIFGEGTFLGGPVCRRRRST